MWFLKEEAWWPQAHQADNANDRRAPHILPHRWEAVL